MSPTSEPAPHQLSARMPWELPGKLLVALIASYALLQLYVRYPSKYLAILVFLAGIGLVVESTEQFVHGLMGFSLLTGISTFVLGVIFGGFDPENLGAGLVGALNGPPGMALGTVIGSATFLLTVALGVAAVLSPFSVQTPGRHILLTLLSPLPLGLMARDGLISRTDGLLLFLLFIPVIWYIVGWSQREHKALQEKNPEKLATAAPKWFNLGLMLLTIVLITVGSGVVGRGAKGIVTGFNVSDTVFGMVFVAAAVSFEEIAREIIPAYRGQPDIAVGNVLGTVLFFVLFNVGIIAMVRPIAVEPAVMALHWPWMMGSLAVVSFFLWRKKFGRLHGLALLALYGVYLYSTYLTIR